MTMKPTAEQAAITRQRLSAPGVSIRCEAGPGTGKTAQFDMTARAEKVRAIYIVFNKTVQREAERRLPGHVKPVTGHGLAYGQMKMAEQASRLSTPLFGSDIAALLHLPALDNRRASQWGQWVLNTIQEFTYSDDAAISLAHLPDLPKRCLPYGPQVVEWAQQIWKLKVDRASDVPLAHDDYLKMWALRGGTIPSEFGVIYQDEGQDTNLALWGPIVRSRLPILLVGDNYQEINQWRRSRNVMRSVDWPMFHLSQSWRFGQETAEVANCIRAEHSQPPTVPLRGNPLIETHHGTLRRDAGPFAVLARTKAALFEQAIMGNDRLHVVGGVDDILKLLVGGWDLYRGQQPQNVPALQRFRSWEDLVQEIVEGGGGPELKLLERLVKEHKAKIPDLANNLKERAGYPEEGADRILGTAHATKGREFGRVMLCDDFKTLDELHEVDLNGRPKYTVEERDAEINLLHVAVTRGRYEVELNEAVRSCVRNRQTPEGAPAPEIHSASAPVPAAADCVMIPRTDLADALRSLGAKRAQSGGSLRTELISDEASATFLVRLGCAMEVAASRTMWGSWFLSSDQGRLVVSQDPPAPGIRHYRFEQRDDHLEVHECAEGIGLTIKSVTARSPSPAVAANDGVGPSPGGRVRPA